jgi:rhodanese-related sulfurtransferase
MSVTRRGALLGAAALLAGFAADNGWAQPAEATRIEADEAVKLAAKGEVVVLDVRNKLAFDGSHAEGALHISAGEIANRLSELPKDKLIAAYCT